METNVTIVVIFVVLLCVPVTSGRGVGNSDQGSRNSTNGLPSQSRARAYRALPRLNKGSFTTGLGGVGQRFQLEYMQKYYIKFTHTDLYVTVRRNKLTLDGRVQRKDLPLVVFKMHCIKQTVGPWSKSGALLVILEHERSGKWVSMTKKGLSMIAAQNINTIPLDNTCVLMMAIEVGGDSGMKFTFRSYRLQRSGSAYFLGFESNSVGRKWHPLVVKGYMKNGLADNNDHNSSVFSLFRAMK